MNSTWRYLVVPSCTPLYLNVPNSICSYLIIPLLSHTFNMSCSDRAFLTHLIDNELFLPVPGCTRLYLNGCMYLVVSSSICSYLIMPLLSQTFYIVCGFS